MYQIIGTYSFILNCSSYKLFAKFLVKFGENSIGKNYFFEWKRREEQIKVCVCVCVRHVAFFRLDVISDTDSFRVVGFEWKNVNWSQMIDQKKCLPWNVARTLALYIFIFRLILLLILNSCVWVAHKMSIILKMCCIKYQFLKIIIWFGDNNNIASVGKYLIFHRLQNFLIKT